MRLECLKSRGKSYSDLRWTATGAKLPLYGVQKDSNTDSHQYFKRVGRIFNSVKYQRSSGSSGTFLL